MGCGCKGSGYVPPQSGTRRAARVKAQRERPVTDMSAPGYYHTAPTYSGPQPKRKRET